MQDIKTLEASLAICEDESKILGLTFDTTKVTPGQNIPKAEAQLPAKLSFHGARGTYIVIEIDIDAPYPSFNIMAPALHWLQPDLKPEEAADGTTSLIARDAHSIADYAGPGPPPFSGLHRCVFMLYEQPQGFDPARFAPPNGKKVGVWPRIRFDLKTFEKGAGLGPVVASNYFLSG